MTRSDLSVIPDTVARWRAHADFQTASECRLTARIYLRHKTPGWRFVHRLEMRRAIRFWHHYAEAIRSAKQ